MARMTFTPRAYPHASRGEGSHGRELGRADGNAEHAQDLGAQIGLTLSMSMLWSSSHPSTPCRCDWSMTSTRIRVLPRHGL